jgi:hypothetical protein
VFAGLGDDRRRDARSRGCSTSARESPTYQGVAGSDGEAGKQADEAFWIGLLARYVLALANQRLLCERKPGERVTHRPARVSGEDRDGDTAARQRFQCSRGSRQPDAVGDAGALGRFDDRSASLSPVACACAVCAPIVPGDPKRASSVERSAGQSVARRNSVSSKSKMTARTLTPDGW